MSGDSGDCLSKQNRNSQKFSTYVAHCGTLRHHAPQHCEEIHVFSLSESETSSDWVLYACFHPFNMAPFLANQHHILIITRSLDTPVAQRHC